MNVMNDITIHPTFSITASSTSIGNIIVSEKVFSKLMYQYQQICMSMIL